MNKTENEAGNKAIDSLINYETVKVSFMINYDTVKVSFMIYYETVKVSS